MQTDLVNDFLRGDFSRSQYVRQARELVPLLKERAREQWKHPMVLKETIAELQKRGFFQMLQPKR